MTTSATGIKSLYLHNYIEYVREEFSDLIDELEKFRWAKGVSNDTHRLIFESLDEVKNKFDSIKGKLVKIMEEAQKK